MVNQLEPAERDIAVVFQNYALYPHLFGTPEKVYHRPATTFVASLIGSPPMNLLKHATDAKPGTGAGKPWWNLSKCWALNACCTAAWEALATNN